MMTPGRLSFSRPASPAWLVIAASAALAVAMADRGLPGPGFLALAGAGAAAALALALPADRLALTPLVTLLALVAYSPAIGSVPENLIFSLPLYDARIVGLSLVEILLVLSFLAAVATRSSNEPWSPRPLTLMVGAFAALVLIAFLRGDKVSGGPEFRRLIPFFLAFASAAVLPMNDTTLRWLRFALLLGAAAAAVRAIVLWIMGLGFVYGEYLRVSVDTGDFLFLSFALAWLFAHQMKRRRTWALVTVAPVMFALIVSFARGAWVMAMVTMIAAIGLGGRRGAADFPRKLVVGCSAALLTALAVLATGTGPELLSRSESILDWSGHRPNLYRLVETRNVVDSIMERPWWGGGLGAHYRDVLALRHGDYAPITTLVHNNFLWLALKGGVILAACFLAILVLGAARSRRFAGHPAGMEAGSWFFASFGFLCGYGVYSLAGGLVQHVRDNILLGIVLGVAAQWILTPEGRIRAGTRAPWAPGSSRPAP